MVPLKYQECDFISSSFEDSLANPHTLQMSLNFHDAHISKCQPPQFKLVQIKFAVEIYCVCNPDFDFVILYP